MKSLLTNFEDEVVQQVNEMGAAVIVALISRLSYRQRQLNRFYAYQASGLVDAEVVTAAIDCLERGDNLWFTESNLEQLDKHIQQHDARRTE